MLRLPRQRALEALLCCGLSFCHRLPYGSFESPPDVRSPEQKHIAIDAPLAASRSSYVDGSRRFEKVVFLHIAAFTMTRLPRPFSSAACLLLPATC